MDEASSKRWRVGYWMTAKKMKKIQFDRFISKCQKENMELLELDFDNIETQLPLHAIVHKLSDFIVQSDQGDLSAKNIIEKMEALEKNHPEVLVLDPIDAVRVLCNRYSQYSLMKTLCAEGPIRTPPFVLLKDSDTKAITALLEKDQISFPFVCKHLAAHGTENAHRMQLVFGPHGLTDIETPCVVQQFICHGGILYKMFAIGDDTFISSRPSLRDFKQGDYPTVAFESHKISKIGCMSHLTKQQVNFSSDALPPEICGDLPRVFAREFRKSTGLSLFGIYPTLTAMAYRNITSLLSRLTLRRPDARFFVPLRHGSLWRPSWWDSSPMSDISRTFENEVRRLQREMENMFSNLHERPWYSPFSAFRPFRESEEQTICEEDGVRKLRLKFDVRRFNGYISKRKCEVK